MLLVLQRFHALKSLQDQKRASGRYAPVSQLMPTQPLLYQAQTKHFTQHKKHSILTISGQLSDQLISTFGGGFVAGILNVSDRT